MYSLGDTYQVRANGILGPMHHIESSHKERLLHCLCAICLHEQSMALVDHHHLSVSLERK